MFDIAKTSGPPLTDQIVEYFAQRIEAGQLAAGNRLPSVRQLAARLDVSAHTVLGAYERLIGLGLTQSRAGAGYFVAVRARPGAALDVEPGWPAASTSEGFAHSVMSADRDLLQCGSGFLPATWFEDVVTPAGVTRALRDAATANIAPTQGLPALRKLLSERLVRRQVAATAGQIVTTFGASQALQLTARCLAVPGDVVLVDDPGYFFLYSQLQALGIRPVSVKRAADGPDLDALEKAIAEYHPRAFFTQTLLHNPTGGNTSPAKSHRLLVLAEANDMVLVEDDVYGELAGEQRVRLAQIGGLSRVVYVSSFTKVLNPALRVGYVAASPSMVERLIDAKLTSVLSGSALEESIVAEVLESGRFNRHIRRLGERLARARSAAADTLSAMGLRAERTDGEGLFIWCSVPSGVNVPELVDVARARGIVLANGALFSRTGGSADKLRFSAASCNDPRLAAFMGEYLPRPGR
ncbi:PLP-dependent aminotransferase family protein [soil metagenome]